MSNDPSSAVAVASRGGRFSHDIGEMLSDTHLIDLTRLRAAAQAVVTCSDVFLSWLDELCHDDSSVAAAAARSYWHPNGFAKLVLHTSTDPEFRLRLHVWPASDQPHQGESNPHSHRWEFASTVVAGAGLHMVEYKENAHRGKLHARYRYGCDPTDPAALRPDGEVRLLRTNAPHVRPGQVYSCDTEVVHTVVPIAAGLTATLVIQGPRRSQSTVVYCEPGQSEDQPNGELSESDFRRLVRSVLAEA
jgi:hypothetical protein